MNEELHEQLMKLFVQLMKGETKDFNDFRNLEEIKEIDRIIKEHEG